MTRKHTRFQVCPTHEGYFAGDTRYRMAETFVEGGPGNGSSCTANSPCRLWPGTDFYTAGICQGEYALDWKVNNR